MKTNFHTPLLLSILTLVALAGCASTSSDPVNESVNYDPTAMPGMPCHQMGGVYMGDCQFDESGNLIENNGPTEPLTSANLFSQSVEGLPEAQSSRTVELKDGDSYEMTASIVKQEVGNRVIKRLAYNGQIPGPMFKVPQNAAITLTFINNLDVQTTLHSHGLRLDNAFDGVPDVTQKAIAPGERFTYQLKFPDAGIYWYHPHVREDYTQELGLYGSMLVQPEEENYWAPVDKEEYLILDDLLVGENQPAFDKEVTDNALMGRFGNVMLVNNEQNIQLSAKKGEVVRFFLTNVANTRTFNFAIEGAQTKLVGGDAGRVEKEALENEFIIAPSERVILEAEFAEEGIFDLIHRTPEKTYKLGQVTVLGEALSMADFETLRENPSDYEIIRAKMNEWIEKEPDHSLRLTVDMMGADDMGMMMSSDSMDHGMGHGGMMHNVQPIEWEDEMNVMNANSTSENTTWKIVDEQTGNENMEINWSFQKGDFVKILVFNDPASMHPMQHPLHFHGQRFVVLSRDGVANENLQWKDTVLIANGETVDLLVEMSNPGTWMAHCHIAEHLHSGMMFGFKVED